MGNGRSAPLQELKHSDLRGNGRRPDNIRGDAANMLIDDQVGNRGEADCVSTERNPQRLVKSTPFDSNKTCLRNSGSGFNDKKSHVWQEIASMYQQIVERDSETILMYRPPVALNGENVDETNCVNTDHPGSSGANTKYVDSSTSTAEDQQSPREYYIIHGVNSTNEADHASTHDVEMIERDIGNNCPRILKSFSLSESHCRFLPGQQRDEYTGGARLEMGNVHGLVYPAQVQDAWTPSIMKTEADTVSCEINESQLQQERHVFKIESSETTSCCCEEPQNVCTEDFNGERIPLQINGTAWNERATNSDLCQMQGHYPQPEHTNQTEPMENTRSFFTRVEESKVSVSERNHYSETEEFRPSAAGPFAVKEEPMTEEDLPSFTDKNMIFGINCESNGSEITLKYGGTEEKGTQYLVEDTRLCPVSASVSSSAWEKNVRVTKECVIYTRSDHGGRLPSSTSYLSSDLSARKEDSVTRLIQENTGLSFTVEDSGTNVSGKSTHEISTHVQAKSRFAVDDSPNTVPEDVLSAFTVDSSTAKRSPENIDPRESKISQLKRLLEKQEEELEKVRSQRRCETDCFATTDDQEQVTSYMEEDLNGDASDDTFVSGQRLSNGHETKEKKSSCPRQNIRNKAAERRETLAQAIRAEMTKQNQGRKGKRKGECFAYLDSTGVVVFGRKVIKKKSAVSSDRLEKLIFRLRKSLGKKKGILKRKSRSKPCAQRHKSPPAKARTKENSPQHRSVAKQIPICKNDPNIARKNKTSEAWEVANPSTNEEKKREHQPSCSMGGNTGAENAVFKDAHTNNQDKFLAIVGLTRKTLDFVTGRFSAHYGGPRRRFLDHEIQPTDCRGMRLGTDFEYRDEQGWFINETVI